MLTIIAWIINILVGALAGWIAGKLLKSNGSFLRNAIIGVIGGLVGSVIFNFLLGTGLGFVGSVLGACLVLWVYEKYIQK